jgi:hypothetical protein
MSDPDRSIGFGRPPEWSRWRKGQSGNPKGRPKSKSDYLNDAAAILSEPVTATTPDGRCVSLDGFEAAYLALCRKGLKRHVPSLLEAIKIMLDAGVELEDQKAKQQAIRERVRRMAERLGLELPDRNMNPQSD